MFACGIALGALGAILDHTQRVQLASRAWRALAALGNRISDLPGWQRFSRIVESRWVPVALARWYRSSRDANDSVFF
ncbi:hypothetical protein I543_0026 [Mycobacteroides abscessus 21]|uniref:Uncharacterized protein n=1 Tax=Mycobacteroides abscessus 21 TaxID=1299324 RepID=A0A829PWU0_9MYCO|nr:hypothetical protein I543_0026 [Mycobacteroides abscessus 21]